MKKSNEKGFLLAEAIVVGVFVLSLFTFLFANIIPLIGKYEAQENYDTIESVYNTNLIRSLIMGDNNSNKVLSLTSKNSATTYESGYYKEYDVDAFCSVLEQKNYCLKLLNSTFLDVNTIYITWYHTAKIKSQVTSNSSSFPRAVRDYIEDMNSYSQLTGAYDNYKRIIVYYNDGTLANLEIKIQGD